MSLARLPSRVAEGASDPQTLGIRTGPGHAEVWLLASLQAKFPHRESGSSGALVRSRSLLEGEAVGQRQSGATAMTWVGPRNNISEGAQGLGCLRSGREKDTSTDVWWPHVWALDRPMHAAKWAVKKRVLEVRQVVTGTNVWTFGERPPP